MMKTSFFHGNLKCSIHICIYYNALFVLIYSWYFIIYGGQFHLSNSIFTHLLNILCILITIILYA